MRRPSASSTGAKHDVLREQTRLCIDCLDTLIPISFVQMLLNVDYFQMKRNSNVGDVMATLCVLSSRLDNCRPIRDLPRVQFSVKQYVWRGPELRPTLYLGLKMFQ